MKKKTERKKNKMSKPELLCTDCMKRMPIDYHKELEKNREINKKLAMKQKEIEFKIEIILKRTESFKSVNSSAPIMEVKPPVNENWKGKAEEICKQQDKQTNELISKYKSNKKEINNVIKEMNAVEQKRIQRDKEDYQKCIELMNEIDTLTKNDVDACNSIAIDEDQIRNEVNNMMDDLMNKYQIYEYEDASVDDGNNYESEGNNDDNNDDDTNDEGNNESNNDYPDDGDDDDGYVNYDNESSHTESEDSLPPSYHTMQHFDTHKGATQEDAYEISDD